jgi:aldehyde dehydrogenase
MATIEKPSTYPVPGQPASPVSLRERYDNFIGGHWVAPTNGEYRDNPAPATGKPFTQVAHSSPDDIELALDAAHAAKDSWGETSVSERAAILNEVADAMESHLEMLAIAESWENGKPVRETIAADLPLAIDHFRYFAGVIRGEEGAISELDKDTVAYHFREPLGVVGQIIPFNFPLLMAAWKIAPALAAGNCTVVKPASPTPWSILKLAEVIGGIVPGGVLNIVNGPGAETGKALASSKRIAKVAFTGETVTGRLIMQYAAQNIIPSTTELGGKSPNVFFGDVMALDDDFLDKAVEGFVQVGKDEGAEVLVGGHRPDLNGELAGGYFFEPTVLKGTNDMRVFQEEIFGPVVSVTTFKDEREALEIANDTLYGLGAGVWTRDISRAYRMGRGIKAGRVWTNCYHQYPAHAAFGGYKVSGVGRETHKMMLDHYTQTKCMLVSYDPKPLGFF